MIYRFNNTEVNLSQFEIRVCDNLVAVEPKVFDLIIYLIQHRDRVISRDELFEQVWQGREVSDTSLSNHVKSARKALGDNGELQCVIKTIRSRGYQFIAELVEDNQSQQFLQSQSLSQSQLQSQTHLNQTSSDEETAFNEEYSQSKSMALTLKLVIFIGLVLCLLSVWLLQKEPAPVVKKAAPTVLVVPFSVSSNQNSTWEPFSDQVTRELIQALRKVSGVNAIAPPSAFTFKDNKIRSYIQHQLPNVDYVLDGVVSEGEEGKLRITVELEDLYSNTVLWDGDYDVQVNHANRFNLQSQVAKSVTDSLQVIILEEEKQQLTQVPTKNLAAYDSYVLGQHQLSLLNHQSVLKAIDYFSNAIDLDPKFEAAYIAKSNAYRILMTYFDQPKKILPKVVASATDLLRINPQSAQVMSLLGLAYVHALQWQEAWDMLSKAKKQDPNLVLTELGFALYYSAMGDATGVKHSLAKANELDPLNEEIADWGLWALMMINELDAAIAWGNAKVKLHPANPYPIMGLSVANYLQGNLAESKRLGLKGVELSGRAPLPLIFLAQNYAAAGNQSKAIELIQEAKGQNEYMCPYETAAVYAILKQPEAMYQLLDTAVDYQSNCLIFAKYDPRFNDFKKDDKYLNLLSSLGL
ncbi:winged helix-turn-helix domain-containing protein [Paraglaciecola aquimarina]|uniref:Winged helix-turn-helix domain-containing protein n=1 Tax=Paraglaciecola algarum TaxID=3050085 RepID=A0ABS9D4S9_9ALTE|nr:winged helix-turn-helix domain-containing protein [Paraglaciecola sp. G1-23]